MTSVVFFGFARGGSSIAARLLHLMAQGAQYAIADITGDAYKRGVSENDIEASEFLHAMEHNSIIGPMRSIPRNFPIYELTNVKTIFLYRDPRDCLVSNYFATRNIHSVFEAGVPIEKMKRGRQIEESIDRYCINSAPKLLEQFQSYIALAKNLPNSLEWKYEKFTMQPTAWIRQVSELFENPIDQSKIQQAIVESSFFKTVSDPMSHNRSGLHGDFFNHIQIETINQLDDLFSPILDKLGYDKFYEFNPITTTTDENLIDTINDIKYQIDEIKRALLSLQRQNSIRNQEIVSVKEKIKKISET